MMQQYQQVWRPH